MVCSKCSRPIALDAPYLHVHLCTVASSLYEALEWQMKRLENSYAYQGMTDIQQHSGLCVSTVLIFRKESEIV